MKQNRSRRERQKGQCKCEEKRQVAKRKGQVRKRGQNKTRQGQAIVKENGTKIAGRSKEKQIQMRREKKKTQHAVHRSPH